jgi:hypothetical protein
MLKNLPDYLNNYKQQITEWFTNSLKSYNFDDPYNSKISYLMQDSAINIALETHIFEQENGVTLTEKIYKPILLKRPFIVYGMPNILSMLRKEGFRTFDGIIDESYDNIIDPDERRLSLVKEIVRLNNLNKVEFEDVLKKCASICNYNSEIVDYYCKKKQLENFKNNLLFGSK